MNNVIVFYIFIIGLCIGSFLNVFVLRGLSGEDFILSKSKCPKCGNKLKWYMNLPLVSYIFLRGRCAFCKEKISLQYPIVELITGLAFLISFLVFGLTFKTLFICIFLSLFIALAATDIIETVIIDYHAYLLFIFSLIYAFFKIGDITILQAIIGGIGGFLIFEILARSGYLIAKYRIFGEGDSLIALGLGGIFGIKNFIIIAVLSILIQSILAIPFLIFKSFKKGNKKLGFSYILVLIAMAVIFYANFFASIKNNMIYIGIVILVITMFLWSLINIIASIRNKEELNYDEAKEKFSICPFGPAMIFAATIGIFYMEQIKMAIKMFLY